ncbi:hypothetical protein ACFLT7_03505, partial [candidate division KSB1 bacterium]
EGSLIKDVRVDLKSPAGRRVESISTFSTDRDGATKVKFDENDGRIQFIISELLNYELAVVQFDR